MRQRLPLASLLLVALSTPALAIEGLWLPEQMGELNDEIVELGWERDPALLGQLDGDVLGSIIDMQYCSAAFVSPDGLAVTAYHCVTDGLQFASQKGEDLFELGFHASTRAEERFAGPTERIRVTTSMEDVTAQVLAGTKKLEGTDRLDKIDDNIGNLVKRCEASGSVHCDVAIYGQGLEYRLITQFEIKDMRLVYSPSNAIGYFGEDADNWRWPRHSGDFAFFRAYVGPDGKPAEYSPNNIPFKPENYLKTAPAGPQPGDFVGVAGYPAYTFRWRSAAELDYREDEAFPRRVRIEKAMLDIMEAASDRDPEVAAKMNPRILNASNNYLYYQGNTLGFERFDTAEQKWQFEQDLRKWIAGDPKRQEKYGDVLDQMHRLQAEISATGHRDDMIDHMGRHALLLNAATTLYQLNVEAAKPDRQRKPGFQNRDRPKIADELDNIDTHFDWRVDRDMTRWFLSELMELPPGMRPAELDLWFERLPQKGSKAETLDAALEALYKNGDLMDPDKRRALMDSSAWYLQKSDNPWFKLAAALQPHLDRAYSKGQEREAEWRLIRPVYIEAVREFYPEARPRFVRATPSGPGEGNTSAEGTFKKGLFYPDANGTLRVTIGKVDGYFPRDGLIAEPRSRLEGILEKAGPRPYDVDEALMGALIDGEYGPYRDERLGSVSVNYLTTLDTARGSSGSATFDSQGRFNGIIFDGNYEAMTADWVFDEGLTRSIHTDLSYILWVLDRVDGAHNVLAELGVKPHFTKGESADASE